jgi:hypothetical protein
MSNRFWTEFRQGTVWRMSCNQTHFLLLVPQLQTRKWRASSLLHITVTYNVPFIHRSIDVHMCVATLFNTALFTSRNALKWCLPVILGLISHRAQIKTDNAPKQIFYFPSKISRFHGITHIIPVHEGAYFFHP